jgi:DNA-binding transcriptional LysR family regulator
MTRLLDPRRLQCFIALAEELHFGRAAHRLGMAQPPLTQQIQKLERELGFAVVQRNPRKTVLTDAGRALLEGAYRILREMDDVREQAQRAGRGESGRVVVGVPPSLMLSALPAAIRRFRDTAPSVRIVIRELSTTAIADGLSRGQLDIGLMRETPHVAGLPVETIQQEPVMAVLPAGHRLATRRRLALEDLAAEPFVLFPRRVGEDLFDRLLAFCADAGFAPRISQEATQWPSVVALVEAGFGVSLAPACVERVALGGVVFRRLPRLSTRVSLCAPAVATSPAAAALCAEIRNSFASNRARPEGKTG